MSGTGLDLFIAKLERRAKLSVRARDALLAVPRQRKTLAAYRDLIREGDPTHACSYIQSGLVSRYKTLSNGSRQILSFHIPGDMVDLQSALITVADHGIRTHVTTNVLLLANRELLEATAEFPELARALWFDTLVDASIFREWTLNVGRRNARDRTAHLLLEMAYRLGQIDMVRDRTFDLPISQADLADAVGISPVHLNRSLQTLRADGMISNVGRRMTIERWQDMAEMSDFRPVYMHPEGPRQLA
jgi:CRP-like cAMP-binding protein